MDAKEFLDLTETILPCPCCGEYPTLYYETEKNTATIGCECGLVMRQWGKTALDRVIAAWNKRTERKK